MECQWTDSPTTELEEHLCHIHPSSSLSSKNIFVASHHVTAPASSHDKTQKGISSCDPMHRPPQVKITTQEAVGRGRIFLLCAWGCWWDIWCDGQIKLPGHHLQVWALR